ncbi:ABC transporter substrate-binding protein [Actinoplanes sp. ATCC 53533]|uniref:ABC transporter substrate-binding protein n=1 Tax=Actinoplanes sp. ATCC 53533 TaxID=1288362 RepID=UPI0018F7B4E1|nr:extracellular solute-binding protein [Actinoplanes sp. ATCC 53533]
MSGLGLGLGACGRGFGGGGDDSAGDAVRLNMVWWGDATRAQKTQAALDIFQRKHSGITVKTEYQDSGPYKDKLATRFAAGEPPDLLAMRTDSLREYADRGALLDLSKHADILDLGSVVDNARKLGVVGDKNFGVPSGLNSVGFVVNKTLADKYGVTIPDGDTWTWDDLASFARRLTLKSGRKVYGTVFEPATLANVIVFTRQRGEDFYTADGKLGLTEATLTAWLEMIEKMRAEGGFPPAGFVDPSIGSSPDKSYLAKGTVASQIIPTNNFLNYNAAAGGNLVLLRMPGETTAKRRGQSIDTPALWSVSAKSKHPKEAVTLLNFLINDVDGAKAVGTTRGVPSNKKIAEDIKATLQPDDKTATDYLIGLQAESLPPAYTYPTGSSKLNGILLSLTSEVEFKRKAPAQAAKEFLDGAREALAQ